MSNTRYTDEFGPNVNRERKDSAMHVQDPNGRLYAVDARDGIAQRVTDAYDAADNHRFFLIRASNGPLAVAFARELYATEWRAKLETYKAERGI